MTDMQLRKAVAVLARKTQDGEVKWDREEPPEYLRRGTDALVDLCYTCTYEGKNLRLHERKARAHGEYDELYWVSNSVLEITDSEGRTLFTFPQVSTLNELWDSVQTQTSGASELIGSLSGSI